MSAMDTRPITHPSGLFGRSDHVAEHHRRKHAVGSGRGVASCDELLDDIQQGRAVTEEPPVCAVYAEGRPLRAGSATARRGG
jgi:hypothetical protein